MVAHPRLFALLNLDLRAAVGVAIDDAERAAGRVPAGSLGY